MYTSSPGRVIADHICAWELASPLGCLYSNHLFFTNSTSNSTTDFPKELDTALMASEEISHKALDSVRHRSGVYREVIPQAFKDR